MGVLFFSIHLDIFCPSVWIIIWVVFFHHFRFSTNFSVSGPSFQLWLFHKTLVQCPAGCWVSVTGGFVLVLRSLNGAVWLKKNP